MKNKQKTPRQVAGEELLAVYAKLAHSKRDLLQETLLKHAFLSAGDGYIKLADWHEGYWRAAYIRLMDLTTQDVAEAWADWANEISTESLSARTVREIILDLVAELVRFRSLECPPSLAHR
jgi:hypothetical protein